MIRSMTAFASSEVTCGLLTINCELRSVNHRYCDIYFKLPEKLRFAEEGMRTIISKQIKRGKIECSLNYKKTATGGQNLIVDIEAVKTLLTATANIEQLMPQHQPLSALDILAFPGIQQEPETDRKKLEQCIAELLQHAVANLLQVREREGRQLRDLLEDRCGQMQTHVETAKIRMPEVLEKIRSRLKERLLEIISEPDFDRLEQEMVILTQKLDVHEELDRLDTHIMEVQRILKTGGPVGRRLDFLMQEMNREANTLGSKSADKDMTQISIELKVLIEQMREQIQNIE